MHIIPDNLNRSYYPDIPPPPIPTRYELTVLDAVLFTHFWLVSHLTNLDRVSADPDRDGLTPLRHIVYKGNRRGVSALIAAGAHLRAFQPIPVRPLITAMKLNDNQSMIQLIKCGGDIDGADDRNSPHQRNGGMCSALLTLHVNTETLNLAGDTPLSVAARFADSSSICV